MQILLLPGPEAGSASRALAALGHRVRTGAASAFTPADDLVLALGVLRDDLSGLPSAYWATGDPWGFEPSPKARWLFSADPHAAARYARPAAVLPPAFDDLAPGTPPSGAWDVAIPGEAFPRRLLVFQALKDLMPQWRILGPGGAESDWTAASVVLVVQRDAMEGNLRRIPPHSADRELYEAAGLGCCVVTDRTRTGAFEAYVEGKEVLSYESIRALPDLIGPLLQDPARRQALGSAARARTLAEHTLRHRLAHLLDRCGTGA